MRIRKCSVRPAAWSVIPVEAVVRHPVDLGAWRKSGQKGHGTRGGDRNNISSMKKASISHRKELY